MSMSDPIADMLTRIRNAQMTEKVSVAMPSSSLKVAIAKVLKDEGYIANYKLTEDGTQRSIRIYLKYTPGNMPVISRMASSPMSWPRLYFL